MLRQRIEAGEPAQVFASADMDHPGRLARLGGWEPPVVFARNRMCAIAAPSVKVDSASLLQTMLRPDIRVGTSTPVADPSGDYAWALFRRADAVQPGAHGALDAKALKLTGAPGSLQAPPGRNTYAWLMAEGRADIFLTYCTGAVAVVRELPQMQMIAVPQELSVEAVYGMGVRSADAAAQRLARYILSPPAQAVLQRAGFGEPSSLSSLLEVRGQVVQPLQLGRAELLALKRRDYVEQRTASQDGRQAQLTMRYQGVPLTELLDRAGLKPDRREIRKAVVLLTAKDGYQASFSWGELYNSSLGDGVFVVLRQGDNELLESDGLPALRSLQDTRSGPRHVRWLTRVDVLLPAVP